MEAGTVVGIGFLTLLGLGIVARLLLRAAREGVTTRIGPVEGGGWRAGTWVVVAFAAFAEITVPIWGVVVVVGAGIGLGLGLLDSRAAAMVGGALGGAAVVSLFALPWWLRFRARAAFARDLLFGPDDGVGGGRAPARTEPLADDRASVPGVVTSVALVVFVAGGAVAGALVHGAEEERGRSERAASVPPPDPDEELRSHLPAAVRDCAPAPAGEPPGSRAGLSCRAAGVDEIVYALYPSSEQLDFGYESARIDAGVLPGEGRVDADGNISCPFEGPVPAAEDPVAGLGRLFCTLPPGDMARLTFTDPRSLVLTTIVGRDDDHVALGRLRPAVSPVP